MIRSSELPRSTPKAQGIASSAIQSFIDTIDHKHLGVHSFMLVRNGHIVADGWWKPYASHLPHSMFSVSKSFTSTAIGLAISEGRLSLDDPILSFFPSYVTPEIHDNMGTLQIRHLLSMSTGHAEDTARSIASSPSEDWVRTFLSLPITYPPGTHFLYNSGATFMLSAILQSLTNQTLVDYLNTRLFQPLGIDKPFWQSNDSGINIGWSGLSIKTDDLAKFGQLYLQRGIWHGQNIVPAAWIEEATSIQVSNGDNPDSDWNQGYGFQFWRSRHNAYRADGAFGQFCIVMPEHNTVLALTSGNTDMQSILDAVWEHLLPAMHAEPQQENVQTTHALKTRLAHLALPLPKSLPVQPATITRIASRTLQLEPNSLHINEISFTFDQDTCTCTIRDDEDTQQVIHCGQTDWILGKSSLWRSEGPPISLLLVAAHSGWTDEHTLVMTWQYIETPFSHILTFDFLPNEIDVSIRLDLPFWVERNEQLHTRRTSRPGRRRKPARRLKRAAIATDPPAETEVQEGRVITLVVSSGPAPVHVPDVTGQTLEAAEATLTNDELVVGTVTKRVSSTQAAGTVLAQSPSTGSSLSAGSKVELTVAQAPKEVEVPDVVGAAEVAAKTGLKHAGFKSKVQTRPTSEQAQVGVVLEQSPTAATHARKGTTVTLVVGMLSTSTTTPTTPTTPTTTTPTTTTTTTPPPAAPGE